MAAFFFLSMLNLHHFIDNISCLNENLHLKALLTHLNDIHDKSLVGTEKNAPFSGCFFVYVQNPSMGNEIFQF